MSVFVNFHTHNAKNQYEIQNCYPNDVPPLGAFSVGIHPWFLSENWQNEMALVWEKSKLENCKAIGESGLDKNIHLEQIKWALPVFKEHIFLSKSLQKPLIIHCVKSFSEIISIRKKEKNSPLWIVHGFQKNEKIAQELLQNGIQISVGVAVLHNENLQKIVAKLAPSNFFIENDNSLISVEIIYQKIAEIKGISVEALQQIQQENFFNL